MLRKGKNALSLQTGASDRGSSQIIWISGLCSLLLVLLAPILNAYQIGNWNNVYVGWIGLVLMLAGLSIRYWAAKTLGEFYTRTLQIVEGQQIFNQAPYSIIRHPGYLGTFLMEIGASLAVRNWVVLLAIVVIGMLWRIYRIQAEEEMLETAFKEQYKVYQEKTWKLIPFIY
ncbi:isoprenylcysteine carboxylmethyltransferase family protein [Aerosakkonemataceae cyanobacterium BLCC-F50]|uniref:Isoprenylcysteine carboxylmethyltransferase family protein n=1 Tax=Floridaenema flaviceps BLCC-F50 TaxID=3153642 RepID=A0ABV4XZS7_9CYAN